MDKTDRMDAPYGVAQLDLSFSGIDATVGGQTIRFPLRSFPDFSLCTIKTLRIFCNDLQQNLEFCNISRQQTEKTLEPFFAALHLLDSCQPEAVEFYLCNTDRIFLYHRLIKETSLLSRAKQLTLVFGIGELYGLWQPEPVLPAFLGAKKLVLVLGAGISAALLRQLQAPRLQTLVLLQLSDGENLHISQPQTPLLGQVVLGLCRQRPGEKRQAPTICACQFPASVKKLVLEDADGYPCAKFSLQGGEGLEELQTQNVLLLGDSLPYGKELQKLRFSQIDKLQLAELPALRHCVVGDVHSLPPGTAARDLLAPRLQTLEIPGVQGDIESCIPDFFTCFEKTQAGSFRPVAASGPRPEAVIGKGAACRELLVSIDLPPRGEPLIRAYTLENSRPRGRKFHYFVGTAEEKEGLGALEWITVTVYFHEACKRHRDTTYFGGDLCHLLRWLYSPRRTPELVLTYLPAPDSTPAQLAQFVPAVQRLNRQLQQSRFLQSIEALAFKDYFTPSPTVFSLPGLKRLRLYGDLDIDWNSARRWNAPGLESLLLDGVRHLPDLCSILAVFPKLEHLQLKGQRPAVPDDLSCPVPRYENICIPARLRTLSIDCADITGLQPGAVSQLRQLIVYGCTLDPALFLQMPRLEEVSMQSTSLTRDLPALAGCPDLAVFSTLDWVPARQLSAFADCRRLRELSINLGNCPEGDLRGGLLFLFRLPQIQEVMLYEKQWCLDVLLALCPELLLRFYPDTTGKFFGMQKYQLLDGQDTDKH